MVTEDVEVKETASVVEESVEEKLQRAKEVIFQLFEAFRTGYMDDSIFVVDVGFCLAQLNRFRQKVLMEYLTEHLNEIGRADLVERIAEKLKRGEESETSEVSTLC